MSVTEIRRAIAELPPEERHELVRSLTRRFVKLTPDERAEIEGLVDAVPEDEWVDWEDLKAELSGTPAS